MMQFKLSYGDPTAPTEIDCQANGYRLLEGYYPDTASDPAHPVTDNAQLGIKGSSPSDLSAKIGALNLAFEHARRHPTGPLGCYLSFAPDGTLTPWRTRLANGITLLDGSLARRWRENKAQVGLSIERAPWWEGAEAQIPLTNANGTNNTTGLTVYNHWDGGTGHENYVSISGSAVGGDLPAATRLQLVNNYATNRLYDVWIGQNWTTPTTFYPILEGENATGGSLGTDASCSNGEYRYATIPSTGELTLCTWTLTADFLNACRGNFFKVLARFYDGVSQFLTQLPNMRFKLKVVYTATTLWESYWVTIDPARTMLIRDLFHLRLPPWLPQQTGLSALELSLLVTQDTGEPYIIGDPSVSGGLDFLALLPTEGWRALTCTGYGIAQNQRIMDDGINGDAYVDDGSGTGKLGILAPSGAPITLKPGTDQRLYFLMHSHLANTAEIARTLSVKLYYRPRRMNV